MSGQNDASAPSCANNPDFAVICSFFEQFNEKFGLLFPSFQDLQLMIENTEEVPYGLVELHVKLLRKLKKSTSFDRWEKAVIKFAHTFSHQDAWELERFGYKKSNTEVKLRLLKNLLEAQFDGNIKFKGDLNKLSSRELRLHPLGRDLKGRRYWHLLDDDCNLRVYREDMDEETWEVVANDRESMVKLIEALTREQNLESEDNSRDTSEESNTNSREAFPKTDAAEPSDPIVSEAIESPVLVICGEGNGADCETANPGNESDEPVGSSAIDQCNDSDKTVESDQANNHDLLNKESNLKEQNLQPNNQDQGAALLSEHTGMIGPSDPGGTEEDPLAAKEAGIHSSPDPSSSSTNTVIESSEKADNSAKGDLDRNEEKDSPSPEASALATDDQQELVDPGEVRKEEAPLQQNSEERDDDRGNTESTETTQVDKTESTSPEEGLPSVISIREQNSPGAVETEEQLTDDKDDLPTSTESVLEIPESTAKEVEGTDSQLTTRSEDTDSGSCPSEAVKLPTNAEDHSAAERMKEPPDESGSEAGILPENAVLSKAADLHEQQDLPARTAEEAAVPEEGVPDTSRLIEDKETNPETETPSEAEFRSNSAADSVNIEQNATEVPSEEILGLEKAEGSLPEASEANPANEINSRPAVLLESAEEKDEIMEPEDSGASRSSVSEETLTKTQTSSSIVENEENPIAVEEQLPVSSSPEDESSVRAEGPQEDQLKLSESIEVDEQQVEGKGTHPETESSAAEESTDLAEDSAGTGETQQEAGSLLQAPERNAQTEGSLPPEETIPSQTNDHVGSPKAVPPSVEETHPEGESSRLSGSAPERNLSHEENLPDNDVPPLEARTESKETDGNLSAAEETNPERETLAVSKQDPGTNLENDETTKPAVQEEENFELRKEEEAHPEAEDSAKILVDLQKHTPGKEDTVPEGILVPETEFAGTTVAEPESGPTFDEEARKSEEPSTVDNPTDTRNEESDEAVEGEISSVSGHPAAVEQIDPQTSQASDADLKNVEPREGEDYHQTQDVPASSISENPLLPPGPDSGGCTIELQKDTLSEGAKGVVEEEASSIESAVEHNADAGPDFDEQPHNGENRPGENTADLQNEIEKPQATMDDVRKEHFGAALVESHPAVATATEVQSHSDEKPSGKDSVQVQVNSGGQDNVDVVQNDSWNKTTEETHPEAGSEIKENHNGGETSGENSSEFQKNPEGRDQNIVQKEDSHAISDESGADAGITSDEEPQNIDNGQSTTDVERDREDRTKRDVVQNESGATSKEVLAEAGPVLDEEAHNGEKRSGEDLVDPQKAAKTQDSVDAVQAKDPELSGSGTHPEGGPTFAEERQREKGSAKDLSELQNAPEDQESSLPVQKEATSVPVLAGTDSLAKGESQQLANSSDVVDVKTTSKLTDLTFDFDESAPLPQLPGILQRTPGTQDSGSASKRGRGRPRSKRLNPDLVVAMQYRDEAGRKTETTPLRQSSRIAKLREKEDEERRKMEAERLLRFKEEMERRERRRFQREERKKRHEEKLQRRQDKVSGKKKIADDSEDSDDSSSVEEKPRKGRKEKKKKKKKKGNTPWDSSETSEESSESDDGLDDLHQEEEEVEELVFKSDHEFSPESDLDADDEVAVPTRHARTAKPELVKKQRKTKPKETVKETEEEEDVDEEEEEEKVDDTNCQKCGQSDHPEWILLCDGCDNGWHASCLRPALLVVPEGDWFCPPCEHATLIDSLQERLEAYDYLLKEKEAEVLRQQTAAAAKAAEAQKAAVPSEEEEDEEEEEEAASGAEEKLAASGAEEESEDSDEEESESESASDEEESADDDAVPGRRQRRAALQANYSFKEYDAMIKSALQDENEDENHVGEKDGKENDAQKKVDDADDDEGNKTSRGKRRISSGSSDEGDRPRPVRRKRVKRLNDLSATSSDNDSDESFKGASEVSDSEEEEDSSAVSTSSFVVDDDSDSDVINVRDNRRGRNSSPPSVRRSTRNPRKRIMVSDTSSSEEESSEEEPRRKRSNRNESWDESEESSSDASWGRRKKKAAAARPKAKKPAVRAPVSGPARPARGGAARGRGRGARAHKNESDDEPFRTNVSVKKLKQKADPEKVEKDDHEDSDQKRRSTRGRQVSYKEMISSGESQEEDEETSKKIAEFLSARIPGRSAGAGTRGRGRGRGSSSGIPFVQSAKPKLPLSSTAAVATPQNAQLPPPESESESRQSIADDFSSAAAAATAAAAVYTTEDSQTSNEVQNLVIAAPLDAELLPTVLPEVADVPVIPEIPAVAQTDLEPKVEVVPAPLPNLPPDLNVSRLIQQAPESPKTRKEPPVVGTPEPGPPPPEPVVPPYSGVIKQVRHSLPPTLAMYPTGPSPKPELSLPTTPSVIRPYPTSAAPPAASNSPVPGNPLSIQGLLSGAPVASTPSVLQQLPSSAASAAPLRPYATTPHIISHAPYLPQVTYASPYTTIGGRNSFGPPAPAASRSPYPNLYPYPGYPPSLRHPGTFQHAGYPQAFAAAAAAAASAEEERRIYRVAQAGREGESPYDPVSSVAKTAAPLEEAPANPAAAGGASGTQESEFGGLVSYFSSQQEDFGES